MMPISCLWPGGALVQRFGLDATTAAFATALLPLFSLTAAEIMREIW